MSNILFIGDLVIIKKELQEIVGVKQVGIIIGETKIIPSEIAGVDLEEIDSYNVYFVEIDTMYTIPKGCIEKLTILQE
jgi:hypothetical protein|tara:strand:- start:185 stop:418 length:234 start_codon:yes stop_codon:yes gene_type:complete